jgi:ATP-binding cassette subfamily B (MDR/TAP) protein 1
MGGTTVDGAERAADGGQRTAETVVGAGSVPLYRLFAFADRTDAALMAVGAVAAVANGMARPLMTFILGDVIDAFGSSDSSNVVHRVAKVRSCVVRPLVCSCCMSALLFCGEKTTTRRSTSVNEIASDE